MFNWKTFNLKSCLRLFTSQLSFPTTVNTITAKMMFNVVFVKIGLYVHQEELVLPSVH